MTKEQSTNPYDQFGFTTASPKDWLKSFQFKYTPQIGANVYDPGTAAQPSTAGISTGDAVPPELKRKQDIEDTFNLISRLQQSGAKTAAESTRQQIASLYPYLSAASAEATARNLAASTQFLLTKEQTPTAQALRNQLAQGQMATAAGAEEGLNRSIAMMQAAASDFPRRYAGQTFSTA